MGVGLYLTGRSESHRPETWLASAQACLSELASEETWSAWDGWRTVWFSSYTVRGPDQRPRSAEELLETAKPDCPEEDAIHHRDGDLIGIGAIGPHEEDGEPMWALKGTSALPGDVAVCSIFFVDEDDCHWAIETWKSVKGPVAARRE